MLPLSLALQAALSFAPPEALGELNWLTWSDFPASAVRQKAQLATRVAVTVDPEGKVAACQALMSAGSTLYGDLACRKVRQLGRFKPALENGVPAWGVTTIGWNFVMTSASAPPRPIFYDIIVPVNRLPGDGNPQGVRIRQVVDVNGKIEKCAVVKASASDMLNRLACQAIKAPPIDPVVDRHGTRVRAIVSQTVLFATQPAVSR